MRGVKVEGKDREKCVVEECRREIDAIVYRLGGWLAVANRLERTPEHLKMLRNSRFVLCEALLLQLRQLVG